uniref:Uncharacterized protein n=1 Tax=Rhizophora mucronata TaxID=61149 RepID=A0A2P2PUX0_RHIMU
MEKKQEKYQLSQ